MMAPLEQDLLMSTIYNDHGNYFFNTDTFHIPLTSTVNTYINMTGATLPLDLGNLTADGVDGMVVMGDDDDPYPRHKQWSNGCPK